MKRVWILLSFLTVLAMGCASAPPGDTGGAAADVSAEKDADSGKEAERKEKGLERKLEVAKARLAVAQLEAEAFERQQQVKVWEASMAVEMAEAKLGRFREADMPNRLASERLDLRTAKDRAQEAADELKQIEIMYEEQDLDDLTAEFVVSRGRRSAERAAARIGIQEAKLKALEERELPEEEKSLSVALDKAKAGLDKASAEGETGTRNKAIAVQEAENTIAGLQDELAALREKKKP